MMERGEDAAERAFAGVEVGYAAEFGIAHQDGAPGRSFDGARYGTCEGAAIEWQAGFVATHPPAASAHQHVPRSSHTEMITLALRQTLQTAPALHLKMQNIMVRFCFTLILINMAAVDKIEKQLSTVLSEGGKLLAGGKRFQPSGLKGHFFQPTVVSNVRHGGIATTEELFGPVVSIIPCEDLEDAIEIANGIEYGLSSALYTKDVNKAFAAIRDLETGITYINAPTIGAEVHLPFGGTKATGNGHREGGIGAIDFYTEWKSVYVDYSDTLQRAQIDRAE